KILNTLSNAGFFVISEPRQKNTNSEKYADKVAAQIDSLFKAKVAPENITIVGASKGAWISIIVSSKLKNDKINYVLMGICDDEYDYSLDMFKICGNILSIYEKSDPLGGSCGKLISSNKDCIARTKEIELNLGNGHGFLFKPYDEWTVPVIEWAKH
ncbi:MAG: alpha/beta hydrolase, partial [Cytophagales bacterium]|nr:alpha/beta hydrolase [Cytophagales bacterium]